jgi:predicted nucleic acid-binding protein
LVAHAAFETYAVLTRLPPPQRSPGDVVVRFLASNFVEPMLVLGAREQMRLLQDLPAEGFAGGASYDALIAATAKEAGEELLTLDRRARATYEAMGVRVRFLS